MKSTISILFLFLMTLPACSHQKFDPLYEEAQKSFRAQNYIDTIDSLNMALARWDSSNSQEKKAQAYQLLGKAYQKIRKFEKSIASYQMATQLSENTFDSAYQLGIIQLAAKKPKIAEKHFRDALRMKKDDPLALVGLGNCYFDRRKYRDAKLAWQRVLQTSPGVQDALEFLRIVNKKLKKRSRRRKRTKRR